MSLSLATSERLAVGLPGVYRMPQPSARALPETPMDVVAFVGLADRGPAWQPLLETGERNGWELVKSGRVLKRSVPVAVDSFDDYRRIFGGGRCHGLMTDAVKVFFEQGGRRAWIVRILPEQSPAPTLDTDCARGVLAGFQEGPLSIFARNRGSWGSAIRVELRFRCQRLKAIDDLGDPKSIAFDAATTIQPGDLLQLDGELARIISVETGPRRRLPGVCRRAQLDRPAALPDAKVDLIHAELKISDGGGNSETHVGLGMTPGHPRWLADVLVRESQLVWPEASWSESLVTPDIHLIDQLAPSSGVFHGGSDDATLRVAPEDMFDSAWTLGDEPGEGVHSLLAIDEVTHVVAPDLYHPGSAASPPPAPPRAPSGNVFSDCVSVVTPQASIPSPQPPALAIDPSLQDGRNRILALQQRLVDLCEVTERFIALIDAPPGLTAREILQWRGGFASPWAALYAPWCEMIRRDNSDLRNKRVPPSAVAAGIVAASENRFGVARGPANWLAREIVAVSDALAPEMLGELHQSGVNLFQPEPDGVRLLGARTASRVFMDRQLSVRRMLLRLRRKLRDGLQWVVFEPNSQRLWSELEAMLEIELRREWRAGSFAGATPQDSYFIKIDRSFTRLDLGELLVEIGVALVEPLEFIVIRLMRDGDGTLQLEAS